MNEDAMDDTIRELARRAYNPPPEPPRDDLWQRIRAELDARRARATGAETPVAGGGADRPPVVAWVAPEGAGAAPAPSPDGRAPAGAVPGVIDLAAARRRRIARWTLRAAPIAALLMLSFYLGRWSHLWDRTTRPRVAASGGAGAPAVQAGPSTLTSSAATAPAPPAPAPLTAAPGTSGEPAGVVAPAPRLLAYLSAGGGAGGRAGARTALYRLAAQQTLGQAEMLLTSFRAEVRAGGTIDPQVSAWAGDVLSSTRLLLDSPAARDPRLRGLLEDLELVLTQIVQLHATPADSSSAETDLIDHALQQRDLMLRLRSAVPAGLTVGT